MIYYEQVKVTINAVALAKVILDMVVQYHGLSNSIVTNQGLVFISNFLSSLYYFFEIKQKPSTAFYSQTNGQTETQNNTIEAYLRSLFNFK